MQSVTEKGFSRGMLTFHLVVVVSFAGENSRARHSSGPELHLAGASPEL